MGGIDLTASTRVLGEPTPGDRRSPYASEPSGAAFEVMQVPLTVGRYRIERRIGVGGMGEVFAATDPRLQRSVAVKLVRRARGEPVEEARGRMRREAQALARLTHPNVATVYDVGEHEGRTYVAMELVDGSTLAQWVEATRPGWRAILRALVEAGRGLAAAHRAGVAHRDFKPSNVMLGVDGRVRVLDFGLARDVESAERPSTEESLDESSERPLDRSGSDLTRAGVVMGTPGYMAPEQLLGKPADARSDQFAFCVSAYRLLWGALPYPSARTREGRERLMNGSPQPPPRGTAVPHAVWAAIERGLHVDPERRHPDLPALLSALERARVGHGYTRLSLPLLGITGALVLFGALRVDAADDCESTRAQAADLWNEPQREQARAAFTTLERDFAHAAFERVDHALTSYKAEWADAREEVCNAAGDRRASPDEIDARVACLERALATARAFATMLESAQADVVARVDEAVAALPAIDRCDASASAEPTVAPEQAAELATLQAELDRLHASTLVADPAEVAESVRAARDRAVALAHAPTLARAQMLTGQVEESVEDFEAARVAYEAASTASAEARDVRSEAAAQLELAELLAEDLARPADAIRHVRNAQALLRRFDAPPLLLARAIQREGAAYLAEGELDAAEAKLREALAATGTDPAFAGLRDATRSSLAIVLARGGRLEASLPLLEDNLASAERRLGPDHPAVANALNSVGATLNQLGRFQESIARLERAQDIFRRSIGRETAKFATVLHNLGSAYMGLERFEEAEQSLLRAVEIKRATLGIDHPSTAWATTDLGTFLTLRNRPAEALPWLRDAVRGFEQSQGEASGGLAFAYNTLLQVLVAQGNMDEARALVERALTLAQRKSTDPAVAGALHYSAALVLWEAGERERPLALAEAGLERMRASERPIEGQINTVAEWLQEHRDGK